eukprot:gene7917-8113_t
MSKDKPGEINKDLASGTNEAITNISTIIQIVRPDVLLINEFDFQPKLENVKLFQDKYLSVPHTPVVGTTTQPISFRYVYLSPVVQLFNTGYLSGFDLDNNGKVELPGDGFGFGWWPGALLPTNPDGTQFFSPEELDVVRLSSKNHIDVVVSIPLTGPVKQQVQAAAAAEAQKLGYGSWYWTPPAWTRDSKSVQRVHLLVSHPTPPVFDGPEDRNGKRNYDEIRFWADYIGCASCPKNPSGSSPGYIYDDNYQFGGLSTCEPFVVMGDQNADPVGGDSYPGAINQLLDCCRTNGAFVPKSAGGAEDGPSGNNNKTDPASKTSSFGLRVDYVVPSRNLPILGGAVWWPVRADPLSGLLRASDHRPVYVDVNVCGSTGCN